MKLSTGNDASLDAPVKVSLHIDLAPKGAAGLELIISAPHWLVNLSSLPVSITHGSGIGEPVVTSKARDTTPRLFSLALFETLEERARLSVPRDARAASRGASALSMPSVGGNARRSMGGRSRGSIRTPSSVGTSTVGVSSAAGLDTSAAPPGSSIGQQRQRGVSRHLLRRSFIALARQVERDLSAPFHVNVIGDVSSVRVPIGGGRNADLTIAIDGEGAASARRQTAVVTVRDKFVLRNHTGVAIHWSEALPLARGGSLVELLLPPGGEDTPLRWSSHDERRHMQVRPDGNFYDWCMPFSPFEAGGYTLKFRRLSDEFAESEAPMRYLRLSVMDEGHQTILELRTPSASLGLPFQICNKSNLLLAFRQLGTTYWEMLGVSEEARFAFDSTLLTGGKDRRKLQLLMCDPFGLLQAKSTTQLEKIDAGVRKVKVRFGDGRHHSNLGGLMGHLPGGSSGDGSDGPGRDDASGRGLPALEALLVSVGCTLMHRQAGLGAKFETRAQYSSGWLCASQNRITFIHQPDDETAADEALDELDEEGAGCCAGVTANRCNPCRTPGAQQRHERYRRSTFGVGRNEQRRRFTFSSGEGWSWHALEELPLAFEEIDSFAVSKSSGRDALWVYCKRGTRLKVADLRDVQTTCYKLQTLLRGYRDVRHTLYVMRLLAERTARTANSAKLIAASWAEKGRVGLLQRTELEERQRTAGKTPSPETMAKAAHRMQAAARQKSARREAQRRRTAARSAATAGGAGDSSWGSRFSKLHRRPHVTALADAVASGSERLFSQLVQRASPDSYGESSRMTALMLAVKCQRGHFMRELLKAGADPDLLSKDGWKQTALHIAAAGSSTFTTGVNLLLAAGANPCIKRADGQTAASIASDGSRAKRELELAEAAWKAGYSERVHRRELAEAAEAKHLSTVQRLLEWHTHPDSTGGSQGLCALSLACLNGDSMMVALLLQNGADPNLPHRRRGQFSGMRPLHLAAATSSYPCAKFLLQARANPMLKDGENKLPLFRCTDAASSTRELMIRSLVAFGGSRIVSRQSQETMVVEMGVTAHGPVRELHVGDPEAVEADFEAMSHQVQVLQFDGSGDADGNSGNGNRAGGSPAAPPSSSSSANRSSQAGAAAAVDLPADLHFTVRLGRLGLSVIDEEPRELLYTSASQLHFDLQIVTHEQATQAVRGDDTDAGGAMTPHLTAEFSVQNFQVDNAITGAEFPVLLASKYAVDDSLAHHDNRAWRRNRRSIQRSDEPSIRLSLSDCHLSGGILCVEAFTFRMHPLLLFVDQSILALGLRLGTSLVQEAAEMEEANAEAARMMITTTGQRSKDADGAQSTLIAAHKAASEGFAPRASAAPAEAVTPRMSEHAAAAEHAEADEAVMEVYIRSCELDQIRIAVTVQIDMHDDNREREFNLSSRELGPLAALGSIGIVDWMLELPRLKMSEVFEEPYNLLNRATRHYILSLLQATYKLFLSLDNLGNVSQMLQAVQGGYSTFRDGAERGELISGALIGVGGVTVGVGQWVLGRLSYYGGGVSSATARLTFDSHFKYHRAHAQQQRPTGLVNGMQIGLEVLEEAVKSGVTGIANQPLRSGLSPTGLVLGVSRGSVGFVAKLASGLFFFFSKTLEGVSASLHRTPFNRSQPLLLLRVRQPRRIDDGVLLPYPPVDVLLEGSARSDADDESDALSSHNSSGRSNSARSRRWYQRAFARVRLANWHRHSAAEPTDESMSPPVELSSIDSTPSFRLNAPPHTQHADVGSSAAPGMLARARESSSRLATDRGHSSTSGLQASGRQTSRQVEHDESRSRRRRMTPRTAAKVRFSVGHAYDERETD